MRKFTLFFALAFLFSGCSLINTRQSSESSKTGVEQDSETALMMVNEEVSKDGMMKKMDERMMEEMMGMGYQYRGELKDVTGGGTIGGISSRGEAGGLARASFEDGTYSLNATFGNLPKPSGTDFYEGWVVRKSPLSVISTGKVEVLEGVYTNLYSSGQDLTDHDFYVLTIEPDDGDPAPAEHVLEGTMKRIES